MLANQPGIESNRIVVRFKNGNILKGVTRDFVPEKPKFHLIHPDERIEDIDTETLKAVFFVKSYEGDKDHQDAKGFSNIDPAILRGIKIKVTFHDNEIIYGSTMGYNKNRKGFFILPADPQSNNIRIYVVASAIKEVKLGSQAEA